ncbi:hypothetical protein EYF80_017835 [Liparis tanakae]|uniref:Uncharacterized protein n=1 Tax=Liparis tanakae TaxID=230148 RepID=A0A4Z2I228_9TELE|nr:hypothetical protein EYF80_017835 [Liparis tanakae]
MDDVSRHAVRLGDEASGLGLRISSDSSAHLSTTPELGGRGDGNISSWIPQPAHTLRVSELQASLIGLDLRSAQRSKVAFTDRTGYPTPSPLLWAPGPMVACWLGVLLTDT